MSAEDTKGASLKQKAVHELEDFAAISLYLALFFCAVVTYGTVLLGKFEISYYAYGSALINALVIAKIILIGEYARLGKGQEARPLFLSALFKAFLFTLLVFCFHVLEDVIKQLVHRGTIASAFHEMHLDTFAARSLLVFSVFIPLFGFRELRRVLGEDKFQALFFGTGTLAKSESNQ
jgi:hypothetical protein